MKGNLFTLMVHIRPYPCEALKPALRRLRVDTYSIQSCEEAKHLLDQTEPYLLFTDTMLPDGTWVDVFNLAEDAPAPICPILVMGSKEPEFRQTALDCGAYDCLEPPFDSESALQTLQRAIRFVQTSRERRARAVVA